MKSELVRIKNILNIKKDLDDFKGKTYKDIIQFAIDNKITCDYCKHVENIKEDNLWCPFYKELTFGKKDFPCFRFKRKK